MPVVIAVKFETLDSRNSNFVVLRKVKLAFVRVLKSRCIFRNRPPAVHLQTCERWHAPRSQPSKNVWINWLFDTLPPSFFPNKSTLSRFEHAQLDVLRPGFANRWWTQSTNASCTWTSTLRSPLWSQLWWRQWYLPWNYCTTPCNFKSVEASVALGGVKYFDFKRATVFGLAHCLSKHKTTRYARNFGWWWWNPCLPGYAYGRVCVLARSILVQAWIRKNR